MKNMYILDPTNESELDKFKDLDVSRVEILENYKKALTNPLEEYKVLYEEANGVVNDFCELDLMKDLKNCVIKFPTLNQTKRIRPFVEEAVSFAKEIGAEDVVVAVNRDDIKTQKYLSSIDEYNMFPVDDEDRRIMFIYEKQLQAVNSRVVSS